MEIKKGKRGRKDYYDKSFKRKVIDELLSGQVYAAEAAAKYGIATASVLRWLAKYHEDPSQFLSLAQMEQPKNENIEQAFTSNELEEALRLAKLKIAGLEAMIDIAEKDFNIEIRKKSGTKPF